jgi:Outer membrane lipoprotein-sorting protein
LDLSEVFLLKESLVPGRSEPYRSLGVVAVLVVLLVGVAAPAAAPSGLDIMRRQRDLQRARDETETAVMRIINRAGDVKERRIVNYELTRPDGLSKTLLRFLAPPDVENTALLTWEGRDGNDDQWLYLPATRRVKRVAASGKKNRFMGTDFSYEDLRPESLALHTYTLVGSERIEDAEYWVIEARPANERQATDSGYGKRLLWIRQDNHFTVKQEYYDKKDRLLKVASARNVVNVERTFWRAGELEMRDVQAGTRTVMVAEKRALNTGLDERVFTETELTRGSL